MKNLFKKRNEEIFKSKPNSIKWFDKEGITKIDENRFVSIEIDDVSAKNSYNGYHVKLFNSKEGLIKSKFFRFSEYLNITFLWLDSGKLEWYTMIGDNRVNVPTEKELKDFVSIIFDYIDSIK